jgi:hypothetical protein
MFKDANGGSPDIDFMERLRQFKLFAICLAYIYINKSMPVTAGFANLEL